MIGKALVAPLWRHMTRARRRQAVTLALLIPLSAAAEFAGVATVVPLLGHLSSAAPGGMIERSGALFIAAALGAVAMRLLLARATQNFGFGLSHDLGVDIQRRLLHQPYRFFADHHSSRSIAALDKVEQFIFATVIPLIQGAGAIVIGLAIVAVLLWIEPISTSLAIGSCVGLYAIVALLTRRRLASNSAVIGDSYDRRVRMVQDHLGAIRDVIIDRSQDHLVDQFRTVDERLARANMSNALTAVMPRHLIEGAGLVVFGLLAIMLSSKSGLAAALPVLGALALGAQRLLPLIQQVFHGWASVAGSRQRTQQVLDLLDLETGRNAPLRPLGFDHEIRLDAVGFDYGDRPTAALSNIDLVIRKGERVALAGPTGSGKSTLADIVMGLLPPDSGTLSVDGKVIDATNVAAWQRHIAHVPQTVFLADMSMARNIAFSDPSEEIDLPRVRRAAKVAQIDRFIDSLPEGYETRVGERGVRLSGGQRQRLGLARAIYKQASLLVLDEATNALDDETEAAVLAALDQLHAEGATIITIAHRASTLATGQRVVRLCDGRVAD